MAKKKYLFIHHGFGLGGAPKSMSMIANRMHKDGEDVTVLFLKNSDAKTLVDGPKVFVNKVPFKYFNHSSRWYRLHEFPLVLMQILSWFFVNVFLAPYWILRLKPDVVYLNSSVLTDWLIPCRLLKVKTLLHVREAISMGYFGFRNSLIGILINRLTDKTIFLSKHNLDCFIFPPDNSEIIYNYTNPLSIFGDASEDKDDALVYVGGEKNIKGIKLIEELLIDRELKFKIYLLGYYSDSFIKKYHNDRVEVIGPTPNALNYINKSKVLLFPATTPHFPRPVIEAFSCKTIPIASNLEGIDEIISENTGFIFKSGCFSSMKRVIKQVMELDEFELENMKNSMFKDYRNRFSPENESKIVRLITGL